jgi:hypothetical protein
MTWHGKSGILWLQASANQHQQEDKMNLQPLSPVQTHHLIALHIGLSQFSELPQEPLKRSDAHSCQDEETISDLAGEIIISQPEMFNLPQVGPDEFEAVFDWFLA